MISNIHFLGLQGPKVPTRLMGQTLPVSLYGTQHSCHLAWLWNKQGKAGKATRDQIIAQYSTVSTCTTFKQHQSSTSLEVVYACGHLAGFVPCSTSPPPATRLHSTKWREIQVRSNVVSLAKGEPGNWTTCTFVLVGISRFLLFHTLSFHLIEIIL